MRTPWLGATTRYCVRREGVVTFGVLFVVLALWAVAVPMFASPDEPAHMIRAEGLVQGNLDGRESRTGLEVYEVSSLYQTNVGCFAFKPDVPADCLALPSDQGRSLLATRASGYPPTFHLLVGWPTLLTGGLKSLYLMRLANAVVCAALLATAIGTVRSIPGAGFVKWGVGVAATPMLFFVSGTVNPSGMAGSAGIAAWTGALALSTCDDELVGRTVARVGAPLCLLLLVRRDSLLWAAGLVCTALFLFTAARLRRLATRPVALFWGALCAAAAAAQVTLWAPSNAESFVNSSESSPTSALTGFGEIFTLLFEAIGNFGWLDTRLPLFVYMVWFGMTLALFLGALAVAPGRTLASMTGAMVLVIAASTVIGAIRHSYLQGRYLLPLLVGVPIVAAFGLSQRSSLTRFPLRPSLVWFGTLFVAHILAFGQQLRRFVVGANGPLDFMMRGRWEPPVDVAWLMIAYGLATAVLLALFACESYRPSEPRRG